MHFTLYNYVLSGNCYKVRLLASLLGVEYTSVAVDFHPGAEHRSERMLQLNAAGTLPVLVAGDAVFTESQAMLVWLAQHHDSDGTWWPIREPSLLPEVVQWLGIANRLTVTVGALRQHTMLNKPVDVVAARQGSVQVLRELESRLTEQRILGKHWLAGANPTVADIACFAYAALSPDAGIEHDDYPALRRWMFELRRLEGFVTMPGIHELHGQRDIPVSVDLPTGNPPS